MVLVGVGRAARAHVDPVDVAVGQFQRPERALLVLLDRVVLLIGGAWNSHVGRLFAFVGALLALHNNFNKLNKF